MIFNQIEAVGEDKLAKIRALSAYSLPINPSERGLTPEQIRARFYAPIVGQALSVITELERVIAGMNGAIVTLEALFTGGEIDDGKKIEDLIRLSEGNHTLKEFAGALEGEVSALGVAVEGANSLLAQTQEEVKSAEQAANGAKASEESAQSSAERASRSAADAETAYNGFVNTQVKVVKVPYGTDPSAEKTTVAGTTTIVFRLPTGAPFRVAKIFSSLDEMYEGWKSDGVASGEFVLIDTGNVEDEENAGLYVKTEETGYEHLVDLSGAAGIQGPDGAPGYTPVRGVDYFTDDDIAYFDGHLSERLGAIETPLDAIITLQNSLIGGESV